MCCVRFTMSPSSRKEVEHHLKPASDMAEVEYRAQCPTATRNLRSLSNQTRIFEELVPSLTTENEFERAQGIRSYC